MRYFLSLRFVENKQQLKDKAQDLKKALESKGHRVYLCQAGPGENFGEQIRNELVLADKVIAFVTRDPPYAQDTGCPYSTYHELEYAHEFKKFLPLKMDEGGEWPPTGCPDQNGRSLLILACLKGKSYIDASQWDAEEIAGKILKSKEAPLIPRRSHAAPVAPAGVLGNCLEVLGPLACCAAFRWSSVNRGEGVFGHILEVLGLLACCAAFRWSSVNRHEGVLGHGLAVLGVLACCAAFCWSSVNRHEGATPDALGSRADELAKFLGSLSPAQQGKSQAEGPTILDLGNMSLDSRGVRPLAKALKMDRTLEKIWLYGNNLGDQGAEYISKALQENHTLQEIYLSSNQIGNTGAEFISKALVKNATLQEIRLAFNQIGDTGAEFLSDALKVNASLIKISLWNNQIGDEGARSLARALTVNGTLKEIDLDHNKIGSEGHKALEGAKRPGLTIRHR